MPLAFCAQETGLKDIAGQTNGAFYHAPSAAELEELYRQIALSTQEEYVLTYHSPRPDFDGTRRDITVRVGETGASGGYVEQHLVTVQSDLLVGLLFLVPLGLALLSLLAFLGKQRTGFSSFWGWAFIAWFAAIPAIGLLEVFFIDNGIRNQLLNNFSTDLQLRVDKGPLFENWAFSEIYKILPFQGSVKFWRSKSRAEVDFVIEHAGKTYALEVKSLALKEPKISRSSWSFSMSTTIPTS